MNIDLKVLRQHTKHLKVLYAEDERNLRESTLQMLKNFFDFIDDAPDGEIALNLYKEFYERNSFHYDIVLTDLLMPRMSGQELTKSILALHQGQEIIVISANADFQDIMELLNAGVNKFITKPIKTDALYKILYDVSANIRQKKQLENEKQELNQYNIILKEREDTRIKALEEFNNALNLSAIVAKTDILGTLTYVNNQFCAISGYEKSELIGHNHKMLKSDKRSSSFYKKLWNTLNDKKTYKTLFENKNKKGNYYFVETTINPILDVDGNIIEFIAVSHDMTQLVNSIEMTKKLEKSKEDFFINISHEMKTPLNAILGFSSLLTKRVKDDSKSLMMVNKISLTGADLTNLINSIIDIRKIQEKSLTLKETIFNPITELNRCLEKYKEKAIKKNQEFKIILDSKIPKTLFGDIVRIIQVLSIILDNAIKFTAENGKVHTNIVYDTFTQKLICEIKDNGIGIAKENQKKIFGIEQLDSSTNRSHEGAGLGLSIASNLLKIMKGDISLKSIPNRGSLFRIEVPLKIS